jgi:hypothetical protein
MLPCVSLASFAPSRESPTFPFSLAKHAKSAKAGEEAANGSYQGCEGINDSKKGETQRDAIFPSFFFSPNSSSLA